MSHYKPYPAYKDSGVEWAPEIPVHWDVKRLRFVASLNPLPEWKDLEGQGADYPFLPMEAIGEAGELDTTRRKPISECRAGYTYFAEGDVAYAKVTPCFENGKGAVMRGLEGGHGFGTTELTVLRPVSIDRDYLYALTFAESFRQPGAAEMLGTGGLKRVPDEYARNYRAALPPPEEQPVIAAAIDRETARIDALIAKKTRFIELLQEKRQALITHAVTKGLDPNVKMKDSGVEWIGEVPAHWVVVQLGKLAKDRCDGPFDSGLKSEHYVDDGVRVVRLQNIGWAEFKGDNAAFISHEHWQDVLGRGHSVVPGDLLVAGLGDENNPLGRACVAPQNIGDAIVKADCYRFRLDQHKALSSFVALSLSATAQAECGFMATGATRDRLNLGLASSRTVALPPTTEEQQAIASCIQNKVARIDLLAWKNQHSIDLLKERRSAFITAAVTGQIDLRESA